jgi:23S rRNA (cytidine1920-2'-O)/16S rRNA (cytidine1409-2'-O)-methyltransferase
MGMSRQSAAAVGGVTGRSLGGGGEGGGGGVAQPAIKTSRAVTTPKRNAQRFAFILAVWNEPGSTDKPARQMATPSKPRPAAKVRVDQLLVDRGLAESRTRAQALVLAGLVFSGESKIAKSGQSLSGDAPLEVRGRDHPWVSRGGIKLAHAVEHFGLDPTGAVAMDIGSSTGGFTDVLLQKGATRVFAVDSGTNQLAWKLRQDPRVTVLEQTSARILTPQQIDAPCDWVVCDASFIGLAKVLEVPLRLAAPHCRLVALIKPQFEVGRGEVGKGGVVRDPALHERVCGEVRDWLEGQGWRVEGIVESPITGPEGNIEFLICAERG